MSKRKLREFWINVYGWLQVGTSHLTKREARLALSPGQRRWGQIDTIHVVESRPAPARRARKAKRA